MMGRRRRCWTCFRCLVDLFLRAALMLRHRWFAQMVGYWSEGRSGEGAAAERGMAPLRLTVKTGGLW